MVAGTFRSLEHRNARWFFAGLLVSNIGAWAQFTAVAILVDRLTGSTTAIGIMTALQFLPTLLFGAYAGALSDRFDRRWMAIATQTGLAIEAAILAVCDLTGVINMPIIYVLTTVMGVIMAFDNPARRGLVTELVPPNRIANAVSLNTATMTGSRIVGPAIAALLIDPLGTGLLFTINALSSIAIIATLWLLREDELYRTPRTAKGGTPVRDALRFVRRSPVMFPLFVVMAVVSTFGYNYNVVFPRFADEIWGDEQWYGFVLTAQSLGAFTGSLLTAGRPTVHMRWLIANGVILGTSLVAMAWAVNPWVALVLAIPLGIGGAGFIASVNSITQDLCPPDMRGRILALGAVAFLGSYPIGGPITGLIGDFVSLEWALAYGGVITLASFVVLIARRSSATLVTR